MAHQHGIRWGTGGLQDALAAGPGPAPVVCPHQRETVAKAWQLPVDKSCILQHAISRLHTLYLAVSSKRSATHGDGKEPGGMPVSMHLQVARQAWLLLGAGPDEASDLAASMAAVHAQRGEAGGEAGGAASHLLMSWQQFVNDLTQGFTEVARQQALAENWADAQLILSCGTAMTLQRQTEAIQACRACVVADSDDSSVAAAEAGFRLAALLRGHTSSEAHLREAEEALKGVLAASEKAATSLILDAVKELNAPQCFEKGKQPSSRASESEESEEEDSDGEAEQAAAADRAELKQIAALAAPTRTQLALLLAQAGRDAEAAAVMTAAGCRYRLSNPVLRYALQDEHSCNSPSPSCSAKVHTDPGYVWAVEAGLPPMLLSGMQTAFAPGSEFWSEHAYRTDGSTPYFSYVHGLGLGPPGGPALASKPQPENLLDQVIAHLHRVACQLLPAAKEAVSAEWWAHCRPHCSGHQLHFDSDNEGVGQVRNPICSMVVYLTEGVGGPTLVTPQVFEGSRMAQSGWLVHPRTNRVCIFKGDMLHGVIPGRGLCPAMSSHLQPDASPPPLQRQQQPGALAQEPQPGQQQPGASAQQQQQEQQHPGPSSQQPGQHQLGASSQQQQDGLHTKTQSLQPAAQQEPHMGHPRDAKQLASEPNAAPLPHRVTFMLALWRDIRVRASPLGQAGAAQPFPYPQPPHANPEQHLKKKARGAAAKSQHTWPRLFDTKQDGDVQQDGRDHVAAGDGAGRRDPMAAANGGGEVYAGAHWDLQLVQPVSVQPVFTDVDEEANMALGGGGVSLAQLQERQLLPAYDLCFQGF